MKDSIGRENRQLSNRACPECGREFRPYNSKSRYCSRKCMWANNGKTMPRVASSWTKCPRGYIQGFVWVDGVKKSYKYHRWIMEQAIGRRLLPTEDVHHINGIKDDNRLENLEIIPHGQHSTNHLIGKPSRNPKGRTNIKQDAKGRFTQAERLLSELEVKK